MYSVPLLAVPPDVSLHSVGFFKSIDRMKSLFQSRTILPFRLQESIICLFFCSLLSRQYPHLVSGAVASSAPVEAKTDFQGYNNVG